MAKFQAHPFHLVTESPWPLTSSLSVFLMMSSLIFWFHNTSMVLLMVAILSTILSLIQWWRDVVRESTFLGSHTLNVVKGLEMGMILFIVSELFFFFSFFWAFFHSSLSPSLEILEWPPKGVDSFDPLGVPMINTLILLSSGVTVTLVHISLMEGEQNPAVEGFIYTILLGVVFTIFQMYEYMEAPFCLADSIYGTTFFVATGFHGLHVIIGTILLMVSFSRLYSGHFSQHHFMGFEAAAWYWHFVDLIWLFLYSMVYWWGA